MVFHVELFFQATGEGGFPGMLASVSKAKYVGLMEKTCHGLHYQLTRT